MARKIIIALGLFFLIGGGVFWWRATHPPLTDQQQIEANLEAIRTALENGGVERIMGYLAEDATFGGQKRSEIRSQLTVALYEGLRRRDVRVVLTNANTQVKGATATTTGHYKVDARMGRFQSDTFDGEFSLEWRKIEGEWKISGGQAGNALQ